MLAEKVIRKHVILIHAYSLMSVLQRKIVNVLLYEAVKGNFCINQQDSVAVECKIPFSTLCKSIKFNSNNTKYLKESIDELASLKIEWNLLKDKSPTDISFLNLRILHGSPTFYKDNTLNFSFHKVFLDLVKTPSIYGTVDIDLQSDFESKYGHALYENSTRFLNLQKNKVIELELFRKMMGVQNNKYSSMREFNRNVIFPAIEEVNDRSNFIVSLETVRSGKKITGFEVSVKNKKKSIPIANEPYLTKDEKIAKEIKEIFGTIRESVLVNILNSYSEEYILEKISYTRKYAKIESSGFYPIAYFISAIKHDYKLKEEFHPLILQEKPMDKKVEWEHALQDMQSELKHWEKMLGYVEGSKNEMHIKIINLDISKCQEKIKQHYDKKPNSEEIV